MEKYKNEMIITLSELLFVNKDWNVEKQGNSIDLLTQHNIITQYTLYLFGSIMTNAFIIDSVYTQ